MEDYFNTDYLDGHNDCIHGDESEIESESEDIEAQIAEMAEDIEDELDYRTYTFADLSTLKIKKGY